MEQVYTNLFPSRHTWYLLGTIVILNGIDWVAFEVLSIGNPTVQDLGSYRVLDGLFQAFGTSACDILASLLLLTQHSLLQLAVRSGGFYIVNIANLRQGLLVLYGKTPPPKADSLKPYILTKLNSADDGNFPFLSEVILEFSLLTVGTPVCVGLPCPLDDPVSILKF